MLVVEKSTFSTHVDGGDYPWFQIVNATGTRGWTSARYMGPIKTADILDLAGSLFSRSLLEFAGDRPETPREILSFNVTDLDGDGIRDILANVTGVIGDGDGGIDPNKAHGSFVIINGGFAWMNNLSSYQWSVDPPSEFRDVVGDSRKELLSYARYGSGDGGETHYWVYGSQASSEAFHALADLVVGYASAGGIYNWRCVSDAPVWTKGESIVESRLSLTRHVELEVSRPRMFSISLKDVFQWTNSGLNRVGSSFVDGSLTVGIATATLFSRPDSNSKPLLLLKQGQELDVTEVKEGLEKSGGYWFHVSAGNEKGWVLDSKVFPPSLQEEIRGKMFENFKTSSD